MKDFARHTEIFIVNCLTSILLALGHSLIPAFCSLLSSYPFSTAPSEPQAAVFIHNGVPLPLIAEDFWAASSDVQFAVDDYLRQEGFDLRYEATWPLEPVKIGIFQDAEYEIFGRVISRMTERWGKLHKSVSARAKASNAEADRAFAARLDYTRNANYRWWNELGKVARVDLEPLLEPLQDAVNSGRSERIAEAWERIYAKGYDKASFRRFVDTLTWPGGTPATRNTANGPQDNGELQFLQPGPAWTPDTGRVHT